MRTTHAEEVGQTTAARKTLLLGLERYRRRDLEAVQEAGETLEIKASDWRASTRTWTPSWPARP